jgi:hypothetical protein
MKVEAYEEFTGKNKRDKEHKHVLIICFSISFSFHIKERRKKE